MDYRNKLGIFTFDDDLSPTIAELIACTVMGQYFSPKPGEPSLHSEQSCYDFIRERCGMVLAGVGFDLVIRDEVRERDYEAEIETLIKADQRRREQRVAEILADEQRQIGALMAAFPGSWLVGPAALK
jgi:hypothetical protein